LLAGQVRDHIEDMASSPIETIEFEKLVGGRPVRCRVVVFPDFACLVSDDAEMTFESSPDFLDRAIQHALELEFVRVPPG
jgi:hypothetical protein